MIHDDIGMIKQLKSGHICCGAGGDIVGAKMTGIQPAWAFDKNTSAIDTVKANHADVKAFVADTKSIDVSQLEHVDILFCGIPCQPYTRIGRLRGENDERAISPDVARVIKCLKPRFVVFENVREYKSSPGFRVLNEEMLKYKIEWGVVNVADFGVPQRRIRLFGLGALDYMPRFPAATHTKERSLFDQKLPWVRFGAIKDGEGIRPLSAKALRGVLRRLARHSKRGNGFSVQIIDEDDIMMTVLGVMYRGSGTSSHSTLVWDRGVVRNVSFLEARRAQGFSDSYIFCGTKKEKWQQVANAIPPVMAKQLIQSMLAQPDSSKQGGSGSEQ